MFYKRPEQGELHPVSTGLTQKIADESGFLTTIVVVETTLDL
jgi:hypothetical protein